MSFAYPEKPDLITLYSDKNLRFRDHMYIRLADYRDMMNRLATDDLLVAQYLLRRTVTHLSKALKTKEPQSRQDQIKQGELRGRIYEFVVNTWNILYDLSDSGKVEIPPSPIDCYEDLYDEGTKKYPVVSPSVHRGRTVSRARRGRGFSRGFRA